MKERERERMRERMRERQREGEKEKDREKICIYIYDNCKINNCYFFYF